MSSIANPTLDVDLSFASYLEARKRELSEHLIGGIPDYAFTMDQKLRQQLAAIPPIRALTKGLVSMVVPLQKQIQTMKGVAVGPKQFPEIHRMGEECARTLGIGIPQIYVYYSPQFDAYTIATEDISPMIVLSSALVEAFSEAELKFVIGHECGHIHNLHGIYNVAVVIMSNAAAGAAFQALPVPGFVQMLLKEGVKLFLSRWSRCAEVTSDRAGLICGGDVRSAQMALAKLTTGGGERLKDINLEEYIKQISQIQSTPIRLMELFNTHPLIPKRLEALRLFGNCDVLHSWRPEMRTAAGAQPKVEVDATCERFIAVLGKGYQPGQTPAG